ncbi:MAG: hypothetical protein Q8927_17560 [Bacteroidota bacterium]|nr:hypothetical protein [Bacteroidota bacterium]MDP4218014.1 hypothetical protein [Bacteroidota bacterium]MDP4244467.1 hypothetical protein [Bacteroidota bacterium]MDP4254800.1 hypothetical protein [Bacteroidota bacterium]MDP4258195.1 hypothetical protein [Bacteroidota bacterium]
MIDHSKEKAEKVKVFRKLMSKWLAVQETERKAHLLLGKNPSVRGVRKAAGRHGAGGVAGTGGIAGTA